MGYSFQSIFISKIKRFHTDSAANPPKLAKSMEFNRQDQHLSSVKIDMLLPCYALHVYCVRTEGSLMLINYILVQLVEGLFTQLYLSTQWFLLSMSETIFIKLKLISTPYLNAQLQLYT